MFDIDTIYWSRYYLDSPAKVNNLGKDNPLARGGRFFKSPTPFSARDTLAMAPDVGVTCAGAGVVHIGNRVLLRCGKNSLNVAESPPPSGARSASQLG